MKITRGHSPKSKLNNVLRPEGIKLRGVGWDKVQNTLSVDFLSPPAELTKRGVQLSKGVRSVGISITSFTRGQTAVPGNVRTEEVGREYSGCRYSTTLRSFLRRRNL